MKLRSQTFEYTRQLLQFVNTNLKREDVQAITRSLNMKATTQTLPSPSSTGKRTRKTRRTCTSSLDNPPDEGQRTPDLSRDDVEGSLSLIAAHGSHICTHPATLPELASISAAFRACIYARIARSQ